MSALKTKVPRGPAVSLTDSTVSGNWGEMTSAVIVLCDRVVPVMVLVCMMGKYTLVAVYVKTSVVVGEVDGRDRLW